LHSPPQHAWPVVQAVQPPQWSTVLVSTQALPQQA
jgi:hypothetical protein